MKKLYLIFLSVLFGISYAASESKKKLPEVKIVNCTKDKACLKELNRISTEVFGWSRLVGSEQFGIKDKTGAYVGFITATKYDYENNNKYYDIPYLGVSPEYRGKGFGKAGVYAFMKFCAERCIFKLSVFSLDKARKFYEDIGFIEEKKGSGNYHIIFDSNCLI